MVEIPRPIGEPRKQTRTFPGGHLAYQRQRWKASGYVGEVALEAQEIVILELGKAGVSYFCFISWHRAARLQTPFSESNR